METVKENESVLVIPDVHGREFWKVGVEKRLPEEKMIFLGDYTDPYPHECIFHYVIPDMLEEILKIPNTVLLLGNHDLSYIYSQSPEVRKDRNRERAKRVSQIFKDNHERFSLTYTLERDNGTYVIFSHAGLIKDLYHHWGNTKKKFSPIEVASEFNRLWENNDPKLEKELFYISWDRGGCDQNGSLVWADIREHLRTKHIMWSHDYQIFGHTILREGCIIQKPQFACVDCQRPVRVWWNMKVPKIEVL